MQGKKLGEEALPRVYAINGKFTLTIIVGAGPSLRREVLEFSQPLYLSVTKIRPKSARIRPSAVPVAPVRAALPVGYESRAWIAVFSPTQKTAVLSGGCKYKPKISFALASKCGSVSYAEASYNALQILTNCDWRSGDDERRGLGSGQPLGGGLERS